MKNLAGVAEATVQFCRELELCGFDVVPSTEPDAETRASVDGVADLGSGFVLRARRGWCYGRVSVTPPLPMEVAVEVNNAPLADEGTRYSTPNGRLGGVARAHGFAGGMSEKHLRSWGSLDHWHVDTVPALGTLVRTLREVIARRGATADAARAEHVQRATEKWLTEEHYLRSGGHIAEIMRHNLHDNPDLDPTHPRIVALRAEFPEVSR